MLSLPELEKTLFFVSSSIQIFLSHFARKLLQNFIETKKNIRTCILFLLSVSVKQKKKKYFMPLKIRIVACFFLNLVSFCQRKSVFIGPARPGDLGSWFILFFFRSIRYSTLSKKNHKSVGCAEFRLEELTDQVTAKYEFWEIMFFFFCLL